MWDLLEIWKLLEHTVYDYEHLLPSLIKFISEVKKYLSRKFLNGREDKNKRNKNFISNKWSILRSISFFSYQKKEKWILYFYCAIKLLTGWVFDLSFRSVPLPHAIYVSFNGISPLKWSIHTWKKSIFIIAETNLCVVLWELCRSGILLLAQPATRNIFSGSIWVRRIGIDISSTGFSS